jgi:membrane protease YdiL (CAAX protease family)
MATLSAIVIVGYYWLIAPLASRLAGPLTAHLPSLSDVTYTAAESIVKLAVAGVCQLALCLGLIWINGLHPNDIGVVACPLVLPLYGLLLGIGEMALASLLGFAATRLIDAVEGLPAGSVLEGWLAMSRGGWMRQYLRTIESAPWPVALSLTVLYVAVEEVIFRAILINIWLPYRLTGLIISVGLFSVVQQFNVPSWRHGSFAFVGGLVMGTIHGILYLNVPVIFPLIAAHVSFFGSALLARREQPGFER